MRRGTTPTHTYTLPFDSALISKLRITYKQRDETVLTKSEEDVEIAGNSVSVTLTQEETLMFDERSMVEIQLKVLTTAGDVLATDVYTIHPLRILDEEVLA